MIFGKKDTENDKILASIEKPLLKEAVNIFNSEDPTDSIIKRLLNLLGKEKGKIIYEALLSKVDVNGNKKIELKEVLNPWVIKWMLIILGSIVVGVFTSTVYVYLETGVWSWLNLSSIIDTVAVPFILGLAFKSYTDDYDRRLKSTETENGNLKRDMDIQKNNHSQELNEVKADKNNEILAQKHTINMLKTENDMLRNGFDPQLLQEYMNQQKKLLELAEINRLKELANKSEEKTEETKAVPNYGS
jgi:hypothetical protein